MESGGTVGPMKGGTALVFFYTAWRFRERGLIFMYSFIH